MSRYIDADALIDFIDVGHLRHPSELCFSEINVVNLLLHAPTADVVEVVRCKDCKYYEQAKVNNKGFLICPASGMEIAEADFCSYRERRSE